MGGTFSAKAFWRRWPTATAVGTFGTLVPAVRALPLGPSACETRQKIFALGKFRGEVKMCMNCDILAFMPNKSARGHIHPISSLIREANKIFFDMGFTFAEGPLLESEWYNFDALNVPKDHPSRDMQDTFFIKDEPGYVLRTHTSPVQVRYMEAQMKKGVMPPYRVIVPGKVFRNEATDMTHEAEFFQIEGLAVGEDITLAHLKGALEHFLKKVFVGASVEIRFRPSFFPFTEPSVEVDMRLVGDNAPEKLRGRWIEMMGAGMVHPNVLRNAGVNPLKYRGFAFGMGLDRLALLRWGIDDIRLMHSADLRFINQF